MLTGEAPYKDVEESCIIYGVGTKSMKLHIPSTCPEGFRLLLTQCWSIKPKTRPSFKVILQHLDIAAQEVLAESNEDYLTSQVSSPEKEKKLENPSSFFLTSFVYF